MADLIDNTLLKENTDTIDALFENLFKTHFKCLYAYAFTVVKDGTIAEEIVQSVFLRLWAKRSDLVIHTSLKAFLYRSVYNESLNYHKHQKVKNAFRAHHLYMQRNEMENDSSQEVQLKELEHHLQTALNKLPEGCRTIFHMSRFEELKYREIAEKLDISVKTVESQMSKALKILRVELADFLAILYFLFSLYPL